MADRVGQQLGNYQLRRLLGRGAFAEVYLGEHQYLEIPAAIKVLHVQMEPQTHESFRREARTIAHLQHPHIVRVLEFGIEDQTPFLVMEYTPNGTLRTLHPKGRRLPLEQIVTYVKQLAPALDYAHQQRVIHRDIKPENMLLNAHQEVLLSDFGLAVVQQTMQSLSTQKPAGTPLYMAPEQIQGKPCPASDQYSLAVVVYEWLCGQPPFRGSLFEVYSQHLHQPPPGLCTCVPQLPPLVEDAVLGALAKDPQQRFPSVQEFAAVLEAACVATQPRVARVQNSALALEEACTAESSSGQTVLVLSSEHPATPGPTLRHNLPVPLTPLIGRELEVATVAALLRRSEVRLLTLTGTGGVGKTRLALQVATELLPDFADGVYFIPLAPISDADLVVPTIAQTLQLKEARGQSFLGLLKTYLQDKHLLLCLDNFEQILVAAPQLTALLTSCPYLKILVTSRATLHLQGEHEFPVPSLALPDLKQLPAPDDLSDFAAVGLFLQRAQAVKPSFQLTHANAGAIAEICIRLDGLPLAIELAAARVKLLSPQALLTRLEPRLQLLTSGAQDTPTRQQMLRNTLDWSYNLLNAQEQSLFRQLSVFVGGCTLEAIETVCAALEKSNGAGRVLDEVASLIDKSLLQQTEQEGEEPRLTMLETIREYGLECLRESAEAHMSQRAHALYYLALAEEAEPHLKGAQQVQWWRRLEREQENLRAALAWLIGQEEGELALRLSGALWLFWYIRGYNSEGWHWLEAALSLPQAQGRTVWRAKALYGASMIFDSKLGTPVVDSLIEESVTIYRELGDKRGLAESLASLGLSIFRRRPSTTVACPFLEESVVLAREVGEKRTLVGPLFKLGMVLFKNQDDRERGFLLVKECEALCRELGDRCALFSVLVGLTQMAIEQGNLMQAEALALECLALARELGNGPDMSEGLYVLALTKLFQGDAEQAVALLKENLILARERGYRVYIGFSQWHLGGIFLHQGALQLAETSAQESLALWRELGDKPQTASALALLGEIRQRQGDLTQAKALCKEGLLLAKEVGDSEGISQNLIGLARTASAEGEPERAALLFGAAEPWFDPNRDMYPAERADYERAVEHVRTQLGEKAFTAAWALGRTMTPEQALAAQGPVMISTPVLAEQSSTPHHPLKN